MGGNHDRDRVTAAVGGDKDTQDTPQDSPLEIQQLDCEALNTSAICDLELWKLKLLASRNPGTLQALRNCWDSFEKPDIQKKNRFGPINGPLEM